MTTMTYEQREAHIKALEAAANDAYGVYDRAERRAPVESPELSALWGAWRRAQDAWEAALREKAESQKAFMKMLRG